MPVRGPLTNAVFQRLLHEHNASLDESPMVVPIGWRKDGSNGVVRVRGSRACQAVVFHVQHTGSGGDTYDATGADASDRADFAGSRVQEYTFAMDGVNRFVVFLVPVLVDADGNDVLLDGDSGPDHLAFVDLGV